MTWTVYCKHLFLISHLCISEIRFPSLYSAEKKFTSFYDSKLHDCNLTIGHTFIVSMLGDRAYA